MGDSTQAKAEAIKAFEFSGEHQEYDSWEASVKRALKAHKTFSKSWFRPTTNPNGYNSDDELEKQARSPEKEEIELRAFALMLKWTTRPIQKVLNSLLSDEATPREMVLYMRSRYRIAPQKGIGGRGR